MRIDIRADDGDELGVQALALFGQGFVRIDFTNRCHGDFSDSDWVTLSADQARDLARALLSAVEAVEGPEAARH